MSERTLLRLRHDGLTPPTPQETTSAWAERAQALRRNRRRKPGPPPGSGAATQRDDDALARWHRGRAELIEMRVAEQRGALHKREDCERDFVARCHEIRTAFQQLPDLLARRLYQAPSPEVIKAQVEEELRRCFRVLTENEPPQDDPGEPDG